MTNCSLISPTGSSYTNDSKIVPKDNCFQENKLPEIPRQSCAVNLADLQAHYAGECKNGKADGAGLAIGKHIYEGQFVNGLPHGQGTWTWVDKKCFTGKFINGIAQVPHTGCEVVDIRLRGQYIGKCNVNNQAHGQGKAVGIDKYQGEFFNGTPNGKGTYIWTNGDRFIGQFKNGQMHGRGVMKYIDGYDEIGKWTRGQLVK
ncbi:MAG: hypothetical protein KAH84_07575 [Thiomargarita sp.]|nr:hypothetical protein [Thiomargarita sp.]